MRQHTAYVDHIQLRKLSGGCVHIHWQLGEDARTTKEHPVLLPRYRELVSHDNWPIRLVVLILTVGQYIRWRGFASPIIYSPRKSPMASTETTSWLITGCVQTVTRRIDRAERVLWFFCSASRGIGLELTRELLASPHNIVLATCRTPDTATKLHALQDSAKGTLHILALDVSSTASIEAVSKPAQDILGDRGLDYLFNNAGIVRSNFFTASVRANPRVRSRPSTSHSCSTLRSYKRRSRQTSSAPLISHKRSSHSSRQALRRRSSTRARNSRVLAWILGTGTRCARRIA